LNGGTATPREHSRQGTPLSVSAANVADASRVRGIQRRGRSATDRDRKQSAETGDDQRATMAFAMPPASPTALVCGGRIQVKAVMPCVMTKEDERQH
jgi:hypothetical protein